jgi:hypothetical protein
MEGRADSFELVEGILEQAETIQKHVPEDKREEALGALAVISQSSLLCMPLISRLMRHCDDPANSNSTECQELQGDAEQCMVEAGDSALESIRGMGALFCPQQYDNAFLAETEAEEDKAELELLKCSSRRYLEFLKFALDQERTSF